MISVFTGAISAWFTFIILLAPMAQAQVQPDRIRATAGELEVVAERLEALAESPAPMGELAQATEELDFDAETIIDFVRDGIRFEPYSGTLKGAHGCLSARAGNALDQALLLATLLKDAGYDARIVRGSLSESDQRGLARASLVQVETPEVSADAEAFKLAMADMRRSQDARATPEVAPPGQVGIPAPAVVAVAERLAELAPLAENHQSLQEALADYFWVEWRDTVQGGWSPVHPAFGPETPPAVMEAAEYFAGSIPDSLQHRMRFEMGIERLENGRLIMEQIMTPWERPAANLFGSPVTLAVMPLGGNGQGGEPATFVPLLNGQVAEGASAFSLTGQLIDLMAAGDVSAGVFKTVSGDLLDAATAVSGNAGDQPLMALTGQYLRVTWIRPDGRERTEERWPLDRLMNRGGEGVPRIAPGSDAKQTADKLAYLRTILVQPAGEHVSSNLRRSSAASASRIRWSGELIDMVDWAEARVASDEKADASFGGDHPLLLSVATLTHHPVRTGDARTTWRDGPFVASAHEVLDPQTKTKAWLDILFNPWRGGEVDERGLHAWPRGSFIRGVMDTAWESAITGSSQGYLAGNPSGINLLARSSGIEQARDRNEGFLLASVPVQGGAQPRWWRVHPQTGEILGMNPLGGAAALEYVLGVTAVGVGAFLIGRSVGACSVIQNGDERACCYLVAAGFGVSGAAGITAGVLAAPVGMTAGAAFASGFLQLKSMLVLDYAQEMATEGLCR